MTRGGLVLFIGLLLGACGTCRGDVGQEPASAAGAGAAREKEMQATTLGVFENPDGSRASFRLEIASTPQQRERGLMHRRDLPTDRGMVFVFPVEEPQVFWMKNTYLPLDMIFVSSDGLVVGIVENARPLTLEPRTVDRPARFVIEVGAFLATRAGIREGSRVRFEPPLPEVRR